MSGEIIQNNGIDYLWKSALKAIKPKYEDLVENGIHKQNVNRLVSSYAYTTCILSGTEWSNFFELRCPKYTSLNIDAKSKKEYIEIAIQLSETFPLSETEWQAINTSSAQPEFQVIAEMIYDLYQGADWKESEYHIPFEDEINRLYFEDAELRNDIGYVKAMKISASMCAKLSYDTQDNEDTLEKHLERANMLLEHKRSEPFSHQAVAMDEEEYKLFNKSFIVSDLNSYQEKWKDVNTCSIISLRGSKYHITEYGWCYNNRGFKSFRYIIENLI